MPRISYLLKYLERSQVSKPRRALLSTALSRADHFSRFAEKTGARKNFPPSHVGSIQDDNIQSDRGAHSGGGYPVLLIFSWRGKASIRSFDYLRIQNIYAITLERRPEVSRTGGVAVECIPMDQANARFIEEDDSRTKGNNEHFPSSDGEGGICDIFLIGLSFILIITTLPLSLFFCFKVVKEYERAVIFRLGRLTKGGARGPGLFFILPCTDNYCNVDLRTVSFNVPPQEVLSKDSVTVSVDAVVYYRVSNATIAISNIANYDTSTQLLAATTLRTVLGTKNLSEILSEREQISHVMQASLDEATTPWGVKVERVEIKDVRLPQQMQRAMAAEAEASREARAKVIAAEGEQKASRALKEAADIINESPGALQLRYLQTLTSIAAEKNSTVVFPLPMELLRGLGAK